jgi:2-hydroxychromene-2-carboxylate isomerase
MPEVSFYFDLGSPFAYLAAERIADTLPLTPSWQPVSLGALFKLTGRSSWALGDPARRQAGMAEVERRARLYGLAPVRWPDPWPSNYLFAMRAATFAQQSGYGQAFARQAFRHAFRDGHDLATREHVLEVARQVGLDPDAVAQVAVEERVKLALRQATDAAHALGVFGVPTVAVGAELFWGEDRLSDAAAALGPM